MENPSSRQWVIVTGSTQGIGRAIAEDCASYYNLIVIARNSAGLYEQKRHLEGQGARVVTVMGDLSDPGFNWSVGEWLPSGAQLWGIVHNAGTAMAKEFQATSRQDFQNMWQLNVGNVFFGTQKVCERLKAQGLGGRVVIISSVAGIYRVPKFPGFSAYATTKAAVIGMAEAIAQEQSSFGITVNCVSPGGVQTGLFEKVVPPGIKAPMVPKDIAGVVSYLLSSQAKCISGVNWEVNAPST